MQKTPQMNTVRNLRKRDQLLNSLLVYKEHQRIAEARFHRYKDLYPQKEAEYIKFCEELGVDSLIPDTVRP